MDVDADTVRNSASLGPISPELALVDPVLAEQARKLLPDPREQFGSPTPVAAPVARPEVTPEPAPAAEPEAPAPRRRWRRILVLAVLVFVAGAISGSLLNGTAPESSGVTFEVLTAGQRPPPPGTTAKTTAPRPAATSRSTSPPAPLRPPTGHEAASGWASNVLGVEARVEEAGVTLAWNRPAGSSRVVVTRARGVHGHRSVLFRGRAASYRDASARPCTAYRYTIVNYDRSGRRSTGVPTSVVTRCG